MTRKEIFRFLATVADCAEHAADATGHDRDYRRLREVIITGEREHRALGRRLVRDVGPRMTVPQACDYFVARCLGNGMGLTRVAGLVGLREDYVRAAILMASGAFRAAYFANVRKAFPAMSRKAFLKACDDLDYATLVADTEATSIRS